MANQVYLGRCLLIINRLQQGAATFDQLKRYLDKVSDVRDQRLSASRRTLQRDIKDIFQHFGIRIRNERSGEWRYFLEGSEAAVNSDGRLLDAYRLVNVTESAQHYKDLVMLEARKATGLEHFQSLLYAAKSNLVVRFEYKKYGEVDESTRDVWPLALKESQHRWYLLGCADNDEQIKTFGLDRIRDVEISNRHFKRPPLEDLNGMFSDFFGIITNPHNKKKIKLSFSRLQAEYIRSFPLHHSQKMVSQSDEDVIFEVTLAPTSDFLQEILSYGSQVKVLEPASLRGTVRHILNKTLTLYGQSS